MEEEIKDWVEDAARSGQLVHSQFHIIQANVFCLTDEKGVVPAEICIARVSLVNGVEEVMAGDFLVNFHKVTEMRICDELLT